MIQWTSAVLVGTCVALVAVPAHGKRCRQDAVQVGNVCVDKYEASVWEIAASNASLIKDVRKGKIETASELSGATERGAAADDYGAGCPDTGNGCTDFYAVSIPGVTPARLLTWFQAAAACANSGKRLLTNQEWQVAALGTPDPGTDNGSSDCNVTTVSDMLPEDPVNTGSRSMCISDRGAHDLVGNLWEWVADWGDVATGCTNWSAMFGGDLACVGGDGTSHLPGGMIRGGSFNYGANAGVFAAGANLDASLANDGVGFRCAREL